MNYSNTLDTALRNLDILREAELTITPLTPTPAMVKAGSNAGELDEHTIRMVYQAMLSANLQGDIN